MAGNRVSYLPFDERIIRLEELAGFLRAALEIRRASTIESLFDEVVKAQREPISQLKLGLSYGKSKGTIYCSPSGILAAI